MVAFYNAADQELYKDYQFVPQEKYRTGFTAPTSSEQKIEQTFGIPNTNAFTNSGGNDFNAAGNAFGYGSPVSEVNVRTFNPQSLPGAKTPGGLNANQMYNIASEDLNNPFNRSAMSTTFPTQTAQDVMDYANESIMDYKEQYGAKGQYVSPYDDTVDQSKYTTTIGNFPSQGFFNRMRNKGFNLAENIPYVGLPIRMLKSFLPEPENRGPGGGTYGIGGLSDTQKTYYNALAKQGFLFDGSGGFKTLTGKNFNLSDKKFDKYVSGQIDMYNKEFANMTEEEIEDKINTYKNDSRKQFKYKQLLEASTMYKTNKQLEKKQKEEFDKPGGTGEQVADIQKRIDAEYEAQKKKDGKDFTISGPDTSANPKGKSNQLSAERGYSLHGADGGRAIFKYGGLASIL